MNFYLCMNAFVHVSHEKYYLFGNNKVINIILKEKRNLYPSTILWLLLQVGMAISTNSTKVSWDATIFSKYSDIPLYLHV